MKFRAPLNKEQAERALFILKSTLYRSMYGWWIPGDFFQKDEKLLEECLNIMSGRYYIQSLFFLEINLN